MEKPVYIDRIPDDARLLHESVYEVRWSDMDAFGHVNNAVYFTYFEQLRIDWLRSAGTDHRLVLATVGCTFRRAIIYPASLRLRLYAGRAGRSSLDTYYEIRDRGDDSCLYTLGHGTIVWYDHETRASVEIPPEIRQLLK